MPVAGPDGLVGGAGGIDRAGIEAGAGGDELIREAGAEEGAIDPDGIADGAGVFSGGMLASAGNGAWPSGAAAKPSVFPALSV